MELKGDLSPVTIADRQAEEKMRTMIMQQFPEHGILGEELGTYQPDAEFLWVLDPIDGTKSFICGVPLFGTLVALLRHNQPILGAMHLPMFDTLLIGDNKRTIINGRAVQLRPCSRLSEAVLLCTDYQNICKYQQEGPFRDLISKVKMFRTWGDCYGYYLLAAGQADIMVDAVMAPWDSLPLIPIIRGAGGVITDYQGNNPVEGKSIIAANASLHPTVISILNSL